MTEKDEGDSGNLKRNDQRIDIEHWKREGNSLELKIPYSQFKADKDSEPENRIFDADPKKDNITFWLNKNVRVALSNKTKTIETTTSKKTKCKECMAGSERIIRCLHFDDISTWAFK